jgi:hypothetical protein
MSATGNTIAILLVLLAPVGLVYSWWFYLTHDLTAVVRRGLRE